MLEDIADPFQQVAKRPARPSHPLGHTAQGGAAQGRLIVPVSAADQTDGAGPGMEEPPAEKPAPVIRISADRVPGEVVPPKWWAGRGDGPRAAVPQPGASIDDTKPRG